MPIENDQLKAKGGLVIGASEVLPAELEGGKLKASQAPVALATEVTAREAAVSSEKAAREAADAEALKSASNPVEENELPQATGSSSRATVWRKKTSLDPRDNSVPGTESAGEGEAFQALMVKANESKREIRLPDNCKIKLTTTAKVEVAEGLNLRIVGGGPGSEIIDACTTGPSIRAALTGETGLGRVVLQDFSYKLGVNKAAFNMMEWSELHTADFLVEGVDWEETAEGFKCLAGLSMSNLWEGSFNNVRWRKFLGHPFTYNNPTLNGGNVAFNDCQILYSSNGAVIQGLTTTNNVQFKNTKFVNANSGREFYEKITTGIPAIGSKEVTVATGIEAGYFQENGCVILYSAAGVDIMHLVTGEAAYNSSTGVLKFRDAVTKEHKGFSDLRVICCTNWSVITAFLCPSMSFIGSHFEQSPAFLKDAPNALFEGCEISVSQKSYANEGRGVYLAGPSAGNSTFKKNFFQHPTGTSAAYSMVCPIAPAPNGTSGLPVFEIDGVETYPPNLAGMAVPEWRPYWSPDGEYTSNITYPAGIKVRTSSKGIERDRINAEAAWGSSRVIEATGELQQNDHILECRAPSAEITITLLRLRNKIWLFKKTDATANKIKILSPSAEAKIDGAESISLSNQYEFALIYYDGTNFQILATSKLSSKQLPAEHGRSAAMVAGEIEIAAPAVTATGAISITTEGGTAIGASVVERKAGVGFKVKATATSTDVVNWLVYTE